MVRWLATLGASVTQPDNNGYRPLTVAVYFNKLAVVQWLAGSPAYDSPAPNFHSV